MKFHFCPNNCRLIGKMPNTYAYTKGLTEYLLQEECGSIPLAIVRPSIVTAALNEPIPGWVDNLNGPAGKYNFILSVRLKPRLRRSFL